MVFEGNTKGKVLEGSMKGKVSEGNMKGKISERNTKGKISEGNTKGKVLEGNAKGKVSQKEVLKDEVVMSPSINRKGCVRYRKYTFWTVGPTLRRKLTQKTDICFYLTPLLIPHKLVK